MRHFKLLVATELCRRVFRLYGTKQQIATLARMKLEDMDPEFSDLVERKYIHEIVPTFGDKFTYKIGTMGGTLLSKMLKDGYFDESTNVAPRKRTRRSRRQEGNAQG